MSQTGIEKVAKIFLDMQQLRIELLGGDNQDIRLGQILEDGKNAMKNKFAKITLMKVKKK